MAFEWKWQPTLDEELSRKARASMEGYKPLSNPSNTYAIAYGNGSGPTLAQIAANGMAGYTSPSSAMNGYVPSRTPDAVEQPAAVEQSFGQGGAGGAERGRMFGANNYGQGMAYLEKLKEQDTLRAELAQNEQRIEQIKLEIQRLKGQSSQYMDAFDMRLAANRARIGDMGNALAHQNRIITRQQLANAKSGSNTSKDLEDIEDKIINAYREYAFAENDEQKQVAQYDINRFKGQYKKKTGKDFQGNPFSIELGTPTNADTFEKAKAKLDASKDKNGRYTESAWKTFQEDIKNVPWSQVDHGYVNDMKKVGTQEDAAKAGAKKLAKQKAALAEAKKNIRRTDLDKSGSYDYTATNGETVNVKRSSFGKAVFSIGKLTETVGY